MTTDDLRVIRAVAETVQASHLPITSGVIEGRGAIDLTEAFAEAQVGTLLHQMLGEGPGPYFVLHFSAETTVPAATKTTALRIREAAPLVGMDVRVFIITAPWEPEGQV